MNRLIVVVYLFLVERIVKPCDDVLTVIDEFWNPTVTNHVIGDVSPAGGSVQPPVLSPPAGTTS